MKYFSRMALLFILAGSLSCQQKQDAQTTSEARQETQIDGDTDFNPDVAALQKSYQDWYHYTYYNIRLAQEFVGLDTDSSVVGKSEFLAKLAGGNHIPIKVARRNGVPHYRLYRLNSQEGSIRTVIRQMAGYEIANTAMEGHPLPDFRFADLEGNRYDPVSTHNKVLVLKCWFIACVACVKEFPELNRLVEKYREHPDVAFVSLAIDTPQKLRDFLAKKPFSYAVVPNAEKYMQDRLGIGMYPTHILVDRSGTIVKVTNSVEDLVPFLEKQVNGPVL